MRKLLPFGIIIFVWFLFASPFFLKGKVPYPSTYQVTFFSPWSTYEQFAQPVRNNAMPDIIGQIYPWRKLTIDIWKSGSIPLWNPYSLSGTPHLANYQSAVLSPFNVLFFLLPFITAWSILILLQSFLAGLFTYLFLKSLKVSNLGSVVASLGFMFCGFLTTWGSYGTLGYAILFLPFSLYCIEKSLQTKKFIFSLLLAISIPLSFFSGHFQISIYFLLFICAYLLSKLITHESKKDILFLSVSVICGVFMSMPQILPSIELYSFSLRSNLFQKTEAIPWVYLPTFLAPDFFGNPVTRNDWFGHYAEWNAYIGFIPFMLGSYALLRRRKKDTLFFLVAGLVAIFLAFESPLLDILVALHVPVLSTSAASRIIVLFSFSFSVLAGIGFDQLQEDIEKRKTKYMYYLLWIFLILLVILWGVVFLKMFIPLDKIAIAKSNLQFPSLIFITTIFILLAGIVIKRKSALIIVSILLIITVADLLRFVNKWQPFESKSFVFPEVPVTQYFKKISGYNRAFGNYGAEVSVYYKLPSVEGYDPVFAKRYGQFIATLQDGQLKYAGRSVVNFSKTGTFTPESINLLGIKYIIHKISDGRNVWAFPFWTYPEGQFKRIFYDGKYEILENRAVLGRAFFVNNYRVEKNTEKIIPLLFKENTYQHTVILEEDPHISISSADAEAKITAYTPNKITIKTSTKNDSLLVLTDTFYPGWTASVDNKSTKIYRADFDFRGVVVPKGSHTVEFNYKPFSFYSGIYLSGIGLLGILLVSVLKTLHKSTKKK